MKSIVELINEVSPLTPLAFAERVGLNDLSAAQGQRIDFDNWLRRCAAKGRQYIGIEDAYGEYIRSFG